MQQVHTHIFIYLFIFTFLYQRYEGTKEKFDSKMMSHFHLSTKHGRGKPILERELSAMVPTAALVACPEFEVIRRDAMVPSISPADS